MGNNFDPSVWIQDVQPVEGADIDISSIVLIDTEYLVAGQTFFGIYWVQLFCDQVVVKSARLPGADPKIICIRKKNSNNIKILQAWSAGGLQNFQLQMSGVCF